MPQWQMYALIVILYILLYCFDLELDTVASLPEGDLKSLKLYNACDQGVVMETPCCDLVTSLAVANFKSINLGVNLKETHTKQISVHRLHHHSLPDQDH